MDTYMNHYALQFAFPSLIRGQYTYDLFAIDMRNTLPPNLMEDKIEFYMHGGLKYNHTGCPLAPPSMEFMDDFEDFS